jgi:hypothetical protein
MRKLLLFLLLIFYFSVTADAAHGGRFSGRTHKRLNQKMLERVLTELNVAPDPKKFETCQARFRKAQNIQDYLLVFCAKAHFDNCAFQKSFNYINRIQTRSDKLAAEFSKTGGEGKKHQRKILLNTGKILHALQDFYSHTNYIELMQTRYENISDVPALTVWTPEGQTEILKLAADDSLISDYTWWVYPKKCPANTPSHRELAKDTADYASGKKATIWKNPDGGEYLNGFEASLMLAEDATYRFLLDTFKKYPMLTEFCGTPQDK